MNAAYAEIEHGDLKTGWIYRRDPGAGCMSLSFLMSRERPKWRPYKGESTNPGRPSEGEV
jgi:hypothetical protein